YHKVGEKIMLDKTLNITINKVQRNWVPSKEMYAPALAGKEYIVMSITMINDGKYPASINAGDFYLMDSGKKKYPEGGAPMRHNRFLHQLITSHDKILKNLAFVVPAGKTNLKLVYKRDNAKNKTIKVYIVDL
ncbi:MAG: DUF4352 domain-containing protein, partial [Candidatus Theseobacter exili]|nr:DUF4352 domain-containing protein [Candidatus Theseobacter exili]